jgi:hypothetical protein
VMSLHSSRSFNTAVTAVLESRLDLETAVQSLCPRSRNGLDAEPYAYLRSDERQFDRARLYRISCMRVHPSEFRVAHPTRTAVEFSSLQDVPTILQARFCRPIL